MRRLTQLVPDIREALEQGLEETAQAIVTDLKERGPYWTGQFETLWEVLPGQRAVAANIALVETWRPTPAQRQITDVEIPASPNLGGYTIGNRADYRLFAMDVLPTTGKQRGDKAGRTAVKNWYGIYREGGPMARTINSTLTNVFRRFQ
jgi:hypothetical protein